MPSSERGLIDSEGELDRLWCSRYGIKAIMASTSKNYVLRVPILDKKEPWVNLKENVIVQSKMMYGKKISCSFWNMKDVTQFKLPSRSVNKRIASVANFHTCTTCGVNLSCTVVLVMSSQFI
jgi:hypothetical protein